MISKTYNPSVAGIYIHVPFCVMKCPYCDFYSVEGVQRQNSFVQAVQLEAEKRAYELEGLKIQSVYFGGGTPSLLSHFEVAEILNKLRACYDFQEDVEITMECNPGDISQMEIGKHISNGVNRFSMGAQSFQPHLLEFLGRRHGAEDTQRMYGYFRTLGVDNISMDLIYGIPGETMADLEADLEQLVELNPEHISTYHLIYEEGTPMTQARDRGEFQEVEEELSIEMADLIRQKLLSAGYEHYEISNFAKPGKRSRHNSAYWEGVPYIGLGPSAHSYRHPWRSHNPSSIVEYNKQLRWEPGFLDRIFERITPEIEFEEYLLTRLRTREGISLIEIKEMGHELDPKLVDEMTEKGWLAKQGDRLHLTERGITLSDAIILHLSL